MLHALRQSVILRRGYGVRGLVVKHLRSPMMASALVAVGLTLACLRSALRGGYLLQVDFSSGPSSPAIAWSLAAPVTAFQWISVHLLGGAATVRLFAFGAVFLCAFAPMVLFHRAPWYARCTAGLLGVLNPWVYERLVEGQWLVIAAAAALFLWLAAWDSLQARPGLVRALLLAVTGVTAVAFSENFLAIVAVLFILAAVSQRVWRERERLKWSLISFGLFILLETYGIVPFFLGRGPASYTTVRTFGRADFVAFSSSTDPHYGLLANLLGLHGYWAERLGRFPPVDGGARWWPVATAVLVVLALVGAWLRPQRRWLLVAGGIGILVSASTAIPAVLDAAVWLNEHVPILAVYREPEKWSALWLLAMVVLVTEAVTVLAERGAARGEVPALAATTAASLATFAALLPSGLVQIRDTPAVIDPVTYPADWQRAATYLEQHVDSRTQVAVLPWHLYESLPFAQNRLVANPASVFFPGNLVTPNDPELIGETVPAASPGDIGRAALDTTDTGCGLAGAVHRAGIHWVVVENAPGGSDNALRLERCGFHLAEGAPGETSVLSG
jgi:hypothetical protein